MGGEELDIVPCIDVISVFLNEMTRLKDYAKSLNIKIADPTPRLDQLFKDTLEEVWKLKKCYMEPQKLSTGKGT
ncbi:hypothetical protein [Metabacillus herbersteinensis]|uniref:hypothetical protein n=1 Tax=Metabacillus herbersteinensis TaxID=283816 RepID=UPI003671F0CE